MPDRLLYSVNECQQMRWCKHPVPTFLRELQHVRDAVLEPHLPIEVVFDLFRREELDLLAQPSPHAHDLEVLSITAGAHRDDVRATFRQEDGEQCGRRIPSWRAVTVRECEPEGLCVLPVIAPTELDERGGSWT